MVPNKKRVNKGDAVYTYKNPGLLDVPIIVGKVSRMQSPMTTTRSCGISPSSPSSKLEELAERNRRGDEPVKIGGSYAMVAFFIFDFACGVCAGQQSAGLYRRNQRSAQSLIFF